MTKTRRPHISTFDDCDTSDSDSSSSTADNGNRKEANARERGRMRVLSRAFTKLKRALPWVPHDTKLSKLDTLRLATSYIAYLHRLLDDDDQTDLLLPVHPAKLVRQFLSPRHGSRRGTSSMCPKAVYTDSDVPLQRVFQN